MVYALNCAFDVLVVGAGYAGSGSATGQARSNHVALQPLTRLHLTLFLPTRVPANPRR